MKKSAILFCFLSLSYFSHSQTIKVAGGMNLARYRFSQNTYEIISTQKAGFTGGIAAAIPVSKNIGIEAGLLYSAISSGALLTLAPELSVPGTYQYTILQLPVMLRISFMPASTPYLLIGPEINLALSHKLKLTDTQEIYDLIEQTNHLGFGIHSGVGYELRIDPIAAFLEIRYSIGLSNMFKSEAGSETARYNSIRFLLGVQYNFP